MTKKLIVLIAVAGLVFSGCTSKKADEEPQNVETADVAKIEGDGSAGLNTGAQATDPSLEAALGTDSGTSTTTTTTTTTDAGATPPPAVDDPAAGTAPVVTDLGGTSTTTETTTMTTLDGNAPPVVDTTSTTTVTENTSPMDMGSSSSSTELTETPITDPAAVEATLAEPKHHKTARHVHADGGGVSATSVTTAKSVGGGGAGMKKIAAVMPYQTKDGAWINTVYVARPKEKLTDISMKIFGTDKSADLKKIAENSFLKARSVKAGDKIFYTSPNRPDDSTKTLIYYEDMGMVPETYVAKKGESLRKISKNLLGYDNAWKEMWASNGLESKTSLKDGETLRYWKEASQAGAAPVAGATLVDAPPAGTNALPPPPAQAGANLPPPPPADGQAPPPPDANAAAAAGTPPPDAGLPPPPPSDLAPPPPPPPDAQAAEPTPKKNLEEATAEEGGTGLDSDTMMSLGALGVLLALLVFVIIRKKKQKAAAAQMNNDINA